MSVSAAEDAVRVTVDAPDGEHTFTGAYLIGADGGRSMVRKQMDIPFEGFTWPERFLVLSTPFDFESECGMSFRNYIADPDEWCNCFKVAGDGPPGLWRTVYPEDPEAPEETLLDDEYVERKLQGFFPAGKHTILSTVISTVHQRVAATFRKGRVLIAGDAAHVNNSIGHGPKWRHSGRHEFGRRLSSYGKVMPTRECSTYMTQSGENLPSSLSRNKASKTKSA